MGKAVGLSQGYNAAWGIIDHPSTAVTCITGTSPPGLTQRVRDSKTTMREAELALLDFVRQHAPEQGTAQLAGNSVHVDRMYLMKYMPELTAHLSYR